MARSTMYGGEPATAARNFKEWGAELIQIVDLDAEIAGAQRNLD
jgi:phosphoribosylformimino-5-aminoimidazole carboxamide ribonucleotide (ProFAR) isomerase